MPIDRDHVAAYAEVCGFEPSQTLPFTYPHMLAFPLHMGIMTDGSFPFPAIGTVHLGNSITQHRPISPSEKLDVSATRGQPAPAPQGPGLRPGHDGDVGRARPCGSRPRRTSALGKGDKDAAAEGEPFDVVAGTGTVWRLPGDLGREYAAVSGDHNPIHLYPLTAKAFGFPRQIAHGMWSKARCVAAMANRLPDAATRRGGVQEADLPARQGGLRVARGRRRPRLLADQARQTAPRTCVGRARRA